ncbi:hypothetical protein OE88DRAFT_497023 [Heliocybe sulcata]|uniref:Uncharacterized protein n=1 Tax=Heliocybe sulcata TaxID=5364 RepID=A0A5C3MX47_9AGAM|nr:hypothetical protein OE88DRAFT_497023 [Heliocybe sulcata]
MQLVDLPVYILSDIFKSACTDGGATGAALSCTSRDIAKFTEPYRYHSVALSGFVQLTAFLDSADVERRAELQMHHLFLCDREKERASDRSGYPAAVGQEAEASVRRRAERQYATRAEEDEKEAMAFEYGLCDIPEKCCKSLRTLSLVLFNPTESKSSTIACLLDRSYPRLTDVSLRLSDTTQSLLLAEFEMEYLSALERLHFASAASLMDIAPDFDDGQLVCRETRLVNFLEMICQIAAIKCIRLSDVKGREGIAAYLVKMLHLEFPSDTDYQMPEAYLVDAAPVIHLPFPSRLRIGLQTWNGVGLTAHDAYGFRPFKMRKITEEGRQFLASAIERRRMEHALHPNEPRIYDLGTANERSYDYWMKEWLERQQEDSATLREMMLIPEDEE